MFTREKRFLASKKCHKEDDDNKKAFHFLTEKLFAYYAHYGIGNKPSPFLLTT